MQTKVEICGVEYIRAAGAVRQKDGRAAAPLVKGG